MTTHPPWSFGRAADLDLDFTAADRPALITEVLEGRDGDALYWWSQPVGARTAALLRLAGAATAAAALGFTATCTCGARFEFELPLDGLQDSASDTITVDVAGVGRTATLRRPTGADLRSWRAAARGTGAVTVRGMIDTLLIDGEVRDGDEVALADGLAAVDPLVDCLAECRCPECGGAHLIGVDLEAAALERLAWAQRTLFGEVHRLAAHYGWSEAEALGIHPARRARYLALIDDAR